MEGCRGSGPSEAEQRGGLTRKSAAGSSLGRLLQVRDPDRPAAGPGARGAERSCSCLARKCDPQGRPHPPLQSPRDAQPDPACPPRHSQPQRPCSPSRGRCSPLSRGQSASAPDGPFCRYTVDSSVKWGCGVRPLPALHGIQFSTTVQPSLGGGRSGPSRQESAAGRGRSFSGVPTRSRVLEGLKADPRPLGAHPSPQRGLRSRETPEMVLAP